MELILINDEKLKIILSNDDMTEMNISPAELDYSKVSTKHIFWNLLDKARKETGFNADKSKLYVQVFPSNDGGCEMFVTKCHDNENYITEKPQKPYCSEDGTENKFIILTFGDLLKLCNRIISDKLKLNTSLYYDSSGTYILIIKNNRNLPAYFHDKENCCKIPGYLSEYGRVYELTERSICYLEEHCKKITAGNAAEILAAF